MNDFFYKMESIKNETGARPGLTHSFFALTPVPDIACRTGQLQKDLDAETDR